MSGLDGDGLRLMTATSGSSGGMCTAVVGGVPTTVVVALDLSVSAGDRLVVAAAGGRWYAVARVASGLVVDDQAPAAPPPTQPASGTLVCGPVETRSYRPTWGWRTDTDAVYQGQYGSNGNHTGCAFYGGKPRSLSGATVTGATLRIRRHNGGGVTAAQPLTVCRLAQATRPGGAPTVQATTAGPSLAWGASTTWRVPTSWAQAIVDGSSGGLGLYEADGAPYLICDGRSSWGPAFTLSIQWRR